MVRATIFSLLVTVTAAVSLIGQTKEDCLACHSDTSIAMERKGKNVSLFVNDRTLLHSTHGKLVCVACHTGFDAGNVPHKEKITAVQCLNCHQNVEGKHLFHKTVVMKGDADPSRMCKNCHGTHGVESPKIHGTKFSAANIMESCGACHPQEKNRFMSSAHGKAIAAGNPIAPTCVQCHSQNITFGKVSTDTAQVKLAQMQVCLSCHASGKQTNLTGPTPAFVLSFEKSVHGMALKRGNGKAANCVNCHGGHEMRKGSDPDSRVNKKNIPATCAQCHPDIAKQYGGSIHGTAFVSGNLDAPVCTNCHGEHKILAPKDPNSSVSKLHVSAQVCAPCHNSVRLNEKFGLPSGRGESFDDSYHGLAMKAGKSEVANCASCHGVHDIRRSSDPASRVNPANLAVTCGKCHPGANANFTKGAVHVNPSSKENDLLYFITSMYIMLIAVTIGGMVIHNIFDFYRKSKRKLRIRRGEIEVEDIGHALYLRMTLAERLQHAALLTSFITLVFTGFMLKFPEAWWVQPIRSLSPAVFEVRGILHRIAAVVLVMASLFHIYYVSFVPRGRQLIKDLFPRPKDLFDAIGVAKYNLGISKVKPELDRFSYVEKSEYWSLVWGTIVMGVTGAILWFDNTSLGLIGKLWWDVASTVHYYEAWLATLAIIVWHFYFVIFNPDVYPINLAFLKGTITEEEMHDEHPLELKRLKQAALEEQRAKEDEEEEG